MKTRKPYPFVHEITDRHGHRRAYFRKRECPTVPLPLPIGSRAFVEAYQAALESAPHPVEGRTRQGPSPLSWASITPLATGQFLRHSLSGPIGTFSII